MRVLTCLAVGLVIGAGVARASGALRVTSPVIGADGRIPEAQSSYGANRSPPLAWTAIAAARSYAIILDDPDAPGSPPFVHWLIWNIPGAVTALPAGLPMASRLAEPAGAAQGRNDADAVGYFGPRPPSGVHHYHFKVFALDALLSVAPGADRGALSAAMNGHVVAVGELVATFAAPGAR
jgi:Raf kinase inhibitor-like YbhB/YbcL family protein